LRHKQCMSGLLLKKSAKIRELNKKQGENRACFGVN
jgi:hypothetical protein